MSELDIRFVKRGFWVNNVQGPVLGQTITVDTRTGGIVVALLAVFTSLGMSHLWNLLVFIYHQLQANGRPEDGHFRQQQALLRTLPKPGSLVADSVKLWYAWRKTSKHALRRTLLFTSISSLFTAALLATGIFSSYVVTGSNLEVLVDSPYCGILDSSISTWNTYYATVAIAVESYASRCYRNGTLPSQCNIFSLPKIDFSAETVSCPFHSTMCASAAIALDSGLVDVGKSFGLNLGGKDEMKYRKRTTCAMLPLEGYTRVVNSSFVLLEWLGREALPEEDFITYHYGSSLRGRDDEFTFGQSLYTSNISKEITHRSIVQYAVDNPSTQGKFRTLPRLHRDDADIALRLNSLNSVLYSAPIDDPMFSAHKATTFLLNNDGSTSRFYKSDNPGTMLGCAVQYQFCFGARNDTCTKLGGLQLEISNVTYPDANNVQLAIISLIGNAAKMFVISDPSGYKVTSGLNYGIFSKLPDSQWILESKGWESVVWAAHQAVIADYAVGPTVRDPESASYVLTPESETEKSLCRMQKMRKPGGIMNINYFGLVFTITLSCTIIIIDITFLRFISTLRKIRKKKSPRIDRWLQDGVFQLQRRAYEAQGVTLWKGLSDEVPVTVECIKLPDLPIVTNPIPSPNLEGESPTTASIGSIASPILQEDALTTVNIGSAASPNLEEEALTIVSTNLTLSPILRGEAPTTISVGSITSPDIEEEASAVVSMGSTLSPILQEKVLTGVGNSSIATPILEENVPEMLSVSSNPSPTVEDEAPITDSNGHGSESNG